jgi:hypothetical protein
MHFREHVAVTVRHDRIDGFPRADFLASDDDRNVHLPAT